MTDFHKLGDDVIRSLSKAAGENPLSAALIGAGILWMMTGAARPVLAPVSRVASGAGSAVAAPLGVLKDAVTSGLDAAAEAATSAAGVARTAIDGGSTSIAKSLSDAPQHTSHYAEKLYGSAGEAAGSLKGALSDLFDRQPIALAAVGLAIGAGIAAALPTSDIEKDVMGKASADVTSTVSSLVRGQADAVKDAVLTEADKQGLTPDKAREALQSGIETVKSVISPA